MSKIKKFMDSSSNVIEYQTNPTEQENTQMTTSKKTETTVNTMETKSNETVADVKEVAGEIIPETVKSGLSRHATKSRISSVGSILSAAAIAATGATVAVMTKEDSDGFSLIDGGFIAGAAGIASLAQYAVERVESVKDNVAIRYSSAVVTGTAVGAGALFGHDYISGKIGSLSVDSIVESAE